MKYKGGISIIIPIYNEEGLLRSEILSLINKLERAFPYEVVLIENGSKDDTYHIACQLAREYKNVRVVRETVPSYGSAVKRGLESAKYDYIVQFDLDLIDLNFFKKAISLLHDVDVVVGSKTLSPTSDKRSFMRMWATRIVNYILRKHFGYKGTDTHGIKAYRKKSIIPILKDVVNTNLFFDTEVLLLSQKNKLRIHELPISVNKLRPTRFTMHIVVFQTILEFFSLMLRRRTYTTLQRPSITADDYGLNTRVNGAIDALDKKKSVDLISILPNFSSKIPHFKAELACHVNIIEGRPLLARTKVPSLVDRRGTFYPFPILYLRLLFNLISFDELAQEIDAQIKIVSDKNKITEINSHQHTHVLYPVDRIICILAEKHGINKVRTYGSLRHFSIHGFLFKAFFILLASFEQLVFGKILSQSPIWIKSKHPISFMSWETRVSPSSELYELVCHPGTTYDKNTMYTSIQK